MDANHRDTWVKLGLALDRAGAIALDVEPAGGLSGSWKSVLIELGIAPLSEDDRFAAALGLKQLKGAPLVEVEAVFRALCGSESGLLAEATARYRQLSTERPKKMFSHALAAAAQRRHDEYAPGAYVLRCPACGAPRLKAKLECDFCGAPIK